MVRPGYCCLMALYFYIIVITEYFFEPTCLTLCFRIFPCNKQTRNLPAYTCRCNNKALAMCCKCRFVCTRMRIEPICPGLRYQLYKILITGLILCKYNQVAARIPFVHMYIQGFFGDIHLTPKNRLKRLAVSNLCQFCL